MLEENQIYDDLTALYGHEGDEPYHIGFWSFDGLTNTDQIVKLSLILAGTLLILSMLTFFICYIWPHCCPREFDEDADAALIEYRNRRSSIAQSLGRDLDECSPLSDKGSIIIETE